MMMQMARLRLPQGRKRNHKGYPSRRVQSTDKFGRSRGVEAFDASLSTDEGGRIGDRGDFQVKL
jgi:hypothetical protein